LDVSQYATYVHCVSAQCSGSDNCFDKLFFQNFEEPQKARLVAFACCINSKLSICDLSCFISVQSALSSQVLLMFLVVIASDLVWYVLHNAVAVTLASSQ
jgi:hypothetical protein